MPGLSGLMLTRVVKAATPSTTVVLISADATPDLEQRALAAGVDYVIPKPFPFERLEAICAKPSPSTGCGQQQKPLISAIRGVLRMSVAGAVTPLADVGRAETWPALRRRTRSA
jgi:CheY-like chemotaxis protein